MNLSTRLKAFLPPRTFSRLKTLGTISAKTHQQAALVGGPVRDLCLGRPSKDIDVAVTFPVEPVINKFLSKHKGHISSQSQFLTFQVSFPEGSRMDIVTTRKETYRELASLPAVEASELLHDLARRDFTVNAMALSVEPGHFGELIDPLGGKIDLERRILRTLHPKSFWDDPTRIFRAARYAARFKLTLEPETSRQLKKAVSEGILGRLGPARLGHEWQKILLENDPRGAIKLLRDWNALRVFSPHWQWMPEHERTLNPRPSSPRKRRSRNPGMAGFPLTICGNDDILALRLLLWCQPFGRSSAEQALAKLQLPSGMKGNIVRGLSLLEEIEKRKPEAAIEALRAPPAIKTFLARVLPPTLWRRVLSIRPILTATNLLNLGYSSGPLLGQILAALARGRWEGTLGSQRHEIRYVIDNFPRG